jgi:octaheme c-type cytochrome (tetrathionate reductase family)
MKKCIMAVILSSAIMIAAGAGSAMNHDFITGPFKDGREVTATCLECHEKQANDVMKTTHWTWKGTPNHVKGREKSAEQGKANMINNFCVSVEGGENGVVREFCNRCHAGYGWTRNDNFDAKDKSRVDCLVCHAGRGNYAKGNGGEVDQKAIKRGSLDLTEAARSVGAPSLRNCGYCHFFSGGGDAVKHAGLDSTLETADKKQDVHMAAKAKGGQGMTCQACHTTREHRIAGASSQMAHYDSRVSCEDCHGGDKAPHKNSRNGAILAKHTARVACQTCHIPVFAKGQATKMMWNWSDVGKDIDPEDQFDKENFAKHKGSFRWEMNVKPVYAWYNGSIARYFKGDKIKYPNTVIIAKPLGSIRDKSAKIYPYKLHVGTQPMDTTFRYLLVFQSYLSLWEDYQWEEALVEGAKGAGLPYSGNFRFVKTAVYVGAQHEVSPKEDALQCGECHLGGTRMDWKALGYKKDPMLKP